MASVLRRGEGELGLGRGIAFDFGRDDAGIARSESKYSVPCRGSNFKADVPRSKTPRAKAPGAEARATENEL